MNDSAYRAILNSLKGRYGESYIIEEALNRMPEHSDLLCSKGHGNERPVRIKSGRKIEHNPQKRHLRERERKENAVSRARRTFMVTDRSSEFNKPNP